jgi:putative two-component system response regulator
MARQETFPNERSTVSRGPEVIRTMAGAGSRPASQPLVLVADDSPLRRREIARALEGVSAEFREVADTADAIEQISRGRVDLIIADLQLPGSGAIDLCRLVKSAANLEQIPVVILARSSDIDSEVPALEAGAEMFLMGPLRSKAFRARVQSCLRRKATVDAQDETEMVLFTLAQSVEGRDPALGLHCERLSLIASLMGMSLGLPPADILALQRGGYLHDVGKVGIPDSVLLKPGPLTPEEWVVMKTHPERGERICSSLRSLAPVLPIIRHHHERWDGSGYPDGLKGNDIPLLARILQFADIYDALTADRPYKKAFSPAAALEIMRGEVAKGWRDPELMAVFEKVVPTFAGQDTTADSLQALAEAIERSRKLPQAASVELVPVKLVSGL